jgi:hypothetical protein
MAIGPSHETQQKLFEMQLNTKWVKYILRCAVAETSGGIEKNLNSFEEGTWGCEIENQRGVGGRGYSYTYGFYCSFIICFRPPSPVCTYVSIA